MNKFKQGEAVCYQDISGFQMAIVEVTYDRCGETVCGLWTKGGEAGYLILPEKDLFKIQNAGHFLVVGKGFEFYGYEEDPCRRLSCDVLAALDTISEEKTGKPLFDNYIDEQEDGSGVIPGLFADVDYYAVEDEITDLFQTYKDSDFDGEPVEKEGE
jgi:hypothetical protein